MEGLHDKELSRGVHLGGVHKALSGIPPVSPASFTRLAEASFVFVVANILSGAAVRLTGSGLGCPDWPTCYRHRLVAADAFHPLMEFGNRIFVIAVVVVALVTLLAALGRRPYDKELIKRSASLVGGIVGEAIVGGIVVLSHLNPYAVAAHFLYAMILVTQALLIVHRSRHTPEELARLRGSPHTLISESPHLDFNLNASPLRLYRRALFWSFVTISLIAVILVAGSGATGAGPHTGAPDVVRFHVPFDDLVHLHALIATLTGLVVVAYALLLYKWHFPWGVQRRVWLLAVVMATQGAIGITQYFLHVPAGLVELHILGATTVWVIAVWQHLQLKVEFRNTEGREEKSMRATTVSVSETFPL